MRCFSHTKPICVCKCVCFSMAESALTLTSQATQTTPAQKICYRMAESALTLTHNVNTQPVQVYLTIYMCAHCAYMYIFSLHMCTYIYTYVPIYKLWPWDASGSGASSYLVSRFDKTIILFQHNFQNVTVCLRSGCREQSWCCQLSNGNFAFWI